MNTPTYAFTVELPLPLGPAIDALRAALAAEQMGIVSEVDVQATLKNKLGLDSHPQKLLGICNPKVAHALLSAEPDIAAMLPCGGSAAEAVPGRTRIALQDPRIVASVSGNAEVKAGSEAVRETLLRVMRSLSTHT